MHEEKAKFIIGEIRNIARYEKIIENINKELQDLAEQIRTLQEPNCPQGNVKLAPVISPSDKTGRVLELITSEQELIAERSEFEKRKQHAISYKVQFFEKCPIEEVFFCTEFFKGLSYETLRKQHDISHPYRHCLRVVKSVL